jgi:hypothetical protein
MADEIKIPVFDPDRGYRQWHIREIYTGPNGTGVYVPNLDDSVLSWTVGLYRVVEINESTGMSVLQPWDFPDAANGNNEDVLLGVGPGFQSESYRLWIDTSTLPYTATPDARLHTYSVDAVHYKIFKGYIIEGSSAQVISAWYNQNQQYVGENIPMALAATDNLTNVTIKAPAVGFTTEEVPTGTPLTLVFYSATGKMISRANLIAVQSTFVRSSESAQRYISSIHLDSPFLSESEENTLLVPMNLPVEALTKMGRVIYSNGENRRVPIDGNKMLLNGLNNYIATINGQKAPLTLVYKLSAGETAENVQGSNLRHIAIPYYLRTAPVDGTYSVKLFVVPQWVDELTGWRLDYFLYNLDRQDFFYATPFIEPGINSIAFNPTLYGTIQELTVAVDLVKLDSRLANYRHVQTFTITLMGNAIEDRTPWFITYTPGQNPAYGGNLKARVVLQSIGNWEIYIDCGLTSLEEWLDQLYYRVQPLFDSTSETKAPAPTHFIVNINGIRNEYIIADWNTALPSITGGLVGKSVIIEWIRKVSGVTLQMGCSPLVIVQEL